jgi:putative cell wall-binding protein
LATSYLEGGFLDDPVPEQVTCSSEFQTHKRYKLAMLPTAVDGGTGLEEGIDLVFNVDEEEGSRDYQVFQKANNWTNGRLEGFTIEVGTGIGDEFVPAMGAGGVGEANLSISAPANFFDAGQLATFSQGLFGPADKNHDTPGFFDQNNRAGFNIVEAGILSGQTDTLTSGAPLVSNYGDLFGPWLPNNMLPNGYFFDDDADPDTDAQLMAWYGFNEVLGEMGWMYGAAGDTSVVPDDPNDGFAAVSDATIAEWEADSLYSIGVIEDLVNVGLNYVVTVGDTTSFESFTIRVTPLVDTSGAGVPVFVVPSAPSGVTGVAGDGEVAVSWTAPTSVGGSAITGYTVTSSPDGATCSTTGDLSCTVTGLTNGTPYTFTVTATNDAGIGPASPASLPVTPVAAPAPIERWAGADRYATSVVVSQNSFPSGANTVFLATGQSFPDALSAGPAAATLGAPILLTRTDQLPDEVSAELERLDPSTIYLLGGTAAIASTVETQLAASTTAEIERIAGADRFETAAAVAELAFATADVVYVAAGTEFADALSAGAPGGILGRPVLLTGSTLLPAASEDQIARLENPDIIVLGGTAVVSDAVVTELDSLTTGSVRRVSGANRYATSVAVSVDAFTAADTVFLTTGTAFPDALSAAPAATLLGAPILLTTLTCAPADVVSEVARLGADRVITLGGPNAVSDAAATLTPCP